jgi:hypothetical protein
MGSLVSELNEKLRWNLASRPSGVDFPSFIGLSRATGNVGVLTLLCSNQPFVQKRWCIQRYTKHTHRS